jgi:hypothetical protein
MLRQCGLCVIRYSTFTLARQGCTLMEVGNNDNTYRS